MTSRFKGIRFLTVLALTLALAGATATTAFAQADNYKNVPRLGGSNRFDPPLKNVAAVQKWVAKKRTQQGITTVMEKAGLAQLTPTVIDILTKADPAQLKSTEFQPGGTMVWMAFRRGGGRPDIVRNIRWSGKKPFKGYSFIIDDMVQTYTFILPEPCSNLALVSSEPSREKARLDAERAEKERLERERLEKERAAAEAARLEAERRERERLEKERLEKERLAKEQAEKERVIAENREKERIEAEQLAAEKKAKWDLFAAGLFGKERRTREVSDNVFESLCAPLLGVKAGAEYKVNPNFKVGPAFGAAINFEEGSYSSIFAEVEANYFATSGKTFLGAGFGVWDFNHTDYVVPSILVHAGQQIWTNAKEDKLFFVGEGRMFLGAERGIENNYQFFGGLRYVIR